MNLRILKNLNWNWAGIFADTAVAFMVCPYLVAALGATHYGLWVMIGSLTGYFGLLDLGIKGSVGRYVSFHRERNEPRAVCEVVSSATALLLTAGLAGLLGVSLAALFAETLVGEELASREIVVLRWAMMIAGVQLMLLLPLNVFDGVLWGCQRFDHLNLVRIPTVVARGVASVAVVMLDGGLVALAVVLLSTTLISGIAKVVLALRDEAGLQIALRNCRRKRIRELVSFGTWNSIRSLTTMLPVRITPLIVGVMAGVAAVTPLSIAGRLVSAAGAIVLAAAGVLTPHATALHARKAHHELEDLFLRGGKYCLAACLFFLTLFVLLGRPLIVAWIGPEMLSAYPLLVILAVGRCLSLSQMTTRGIVTAQARHKSLALVGIGQAVMTLGLGTLCLQSWGVVGFVFVAALGDACCEGLFSLLYGCRLLDVPLRKYFAVVFGAGVRMLLPSIALTLLVVWRPAVSGYDVVCYGAGFTVLCGIVYLYAIDRINVFSILRERLRYDAISS